MTRSVQVRLLGAAIIVCAAIAALWFNRRWVPFPVAIADRWRAIHSEKATADQMGMPPLVFWAWERPDDLSDLDTRRAGVAFLAGTIFIRSIAPDRGDVPDEGVVLRPRLRPLRVPERVPLMAVVRIETKQGWSQSSYQTAQPTESADGPYTEEQRRRVVSSISRLVALSEVRALQIDFDATRSEQGFYRAVLIDLRKALPSGTPVSITALASWCVGDPWLEKLPPGTINEAVPMLFRMGPDGPNVASFLSGGNEFRVAACRGSIGVSTDESFSKEILRNGGVGNAGGLQAKRVYVFHPKAWNAEAVEKTIGAVYKWHEESATVHFQLLGTGIRSVAPALTGTGLRKRRIDFDGVAK